jgi:hypothetical protein
MDGVNISTLYFALPLCITFEIFSLFVDILLPAFMNAVQVIIKAFSGIPHSSTVTAVLIVSTLALRGLSMLI